MSGEAMSGFGSPETQPSHPYYSSNTMKEVVPEACAEALSSPQAALQPVAPEQSIKPGAAGTSQMSWLPIESPYPPRHPDESTLVGERRRNTVCGMSVATIALAVALLVVVIGAAVGGGVGGSMAASTSRSLEECRSALNQRSSLPTTTPSTPLSPTGAPDGNCTANKRVLQTGPNGGIVPPTKDVVVELDCPAMQSAQKILTLGGKRLTFAIRCGEDFNRKDIGAAISYSMDDCLYSCASYNVISGRQECIAVTFTAELSDSVAARGGNCWLKNETATPRRNLGNKIATGRLEMIGT